MLLVASQLGLPGQQKGSLPGNELVSHFSRELMKEYSLLYRTDSRLLVLILFGLLLLLTAAGLAK